MTKRRAIKIATSAITVLILGVLGAGVQQNGKLSVPSIKPADTTQPGYYKVLQVTDGDTINVQVAGQKETVRLIGIDTPEVKDPRKPVQCFGKAASAETHKLLDGKTVRLEGDPQNSDRDKYHRLLRYVYLPDGTMVNQYLVENGFAFTYTLFPFSKLDQFRLLERKAREQNKGLWGGCEVRKEGDKEQTQDQP
jgi:micrococcal nuclease